jgi:hypothetical protein
MRRRELLAAGSTLLAATSGCIGVLTGSEPLEREATSARVGKATLEETGYELADSYSDTIEQEVTVRGQTREVHAVNQFTEYHRAVELATLGSGEYAVFALVATPAFEIAGQVMSPVERWSNRRVAAELQQQYEDLEVGEEVDSTTVPTLSAEMSVSTFEGTATVLGNEGVDVYLNVGKVRHEEDFVFAVGIHPQSLSGERETVLELVRNLEHG